MACRAVLVLAVATSAAGVATVGASAKGDGPTAIASGDGVVWVGTGGGALLRLDPKTGELGRIPAVGFVTDVVTSRGAVWVGRSSLTVARVDPRTRRLDAVAPLGGAGGWVPGPGALAAGAGSIWVGDSNAGRVFRVDPRTARTVAVSQVPGRVVDVAAGPGGGFVVYRPGPGPLTLGGGRVLRRVDARTARPVGPGVRFRCDVGIAVGRRAVWTVDYCSWRLAKRHPKTLAVLASRRVPQLITGVLHAHGSVWVYGGSRVLRIDPATLRVRALVWVRAGAAAATPGSVWLLDHGDGTIGFVRELDVRTNRVVRAVRIRG